MIITTNEYGIPKCQLKYLKLKRNRDTYIVYHLNIE